MNIIRLIAKNQKAFIAGLSFFIVLEMLGTLFMLYSQDEVLTYIVEDSAQEYALELKIANNALSEKAQILYDTVLNIPKMHTIMLQASQTKDVTKLVQLREELYKLFSSKYRYMQSKSVRQLHFHLPNSISFLRFHRPKKYGDFLAEVRPSLKYVNKYRVPIHCFEEGRIFNAFRNVYPIFTENTFVGTVEVSYSAVALEEEMKVLKDSSMTFLLNTNIVDKKVYADEKSNYTQSEFKGLMYDRKTKGLKGIFTEKEISFINNHIQKLALKKLQEKKMFALLFYNTKLYGGRSIAINFLPIKNLDEKQVAYVVSYKFSNIADVVLSKNIVFILLTALISFIISLMVFILLAKAKRKEDMVLELARHDTLTGIYNRYGMKDILEQRVGEFERFRRDLSIVFFDIDYFKLINDTYGHDKGDYILKTLSTLVDNCIRKSDIFARWGGEEFVIILPETSILEATLLAEKLRRSIEEYDFELKNSLTCSFGVTQLKEGECQDTIMKRADEFLYRAKELGRNRIINSIES